LAEGGDTAKKIGMLTEENLSKWPQMATEQRLEVYKAKVEVEIDAQQRLLRQFGEGDPKYVKDVQHSLENLEVRLAEVESGIKNPQSVKEADWLKEKQLPHLFSKQSKVPEQVRDMMLSQKIAPDILEKGVHFNVGKIEFRAVPDHLGGIVLKPVHPGMINNNSKLAKQYEQALKEANDAMNYPEFRAWLKVCAQRGLEFASTSEGHKDKAAEFNFLLKALERLE
jgi:hypothetical protein